MNAWKEYFIRKDRIDFAFAVKLIAIIVFSLSFVYVNAGFSSSLHLQPNSSIEMQAEDCLNESRQILLELQSEGFSVQRVNDSLKQLESLFNAQKTIKEKKEKHDFSVVFPYCEEIKEIREKAFISKDELEGLKRFYAEFLEGTGINTSSVDKIINEIEAEIKNERYEKVPDLTDEAYNEILNLRSSQTAFKLFYEATSNSIEKFLYKNWKFFSGFIFMAVLLFLIYHSALRKMILMRKLERLELRKKTLKNLIMKTQKDYFTYGKISEGTFNIRTKKLAELIRDIDRQIPLLKEEMMKLDRKRKR